MNVLVTGSSRGIGLAIARKFSEEGHRVVVNGRNDEILTNIACIHPKLIPIAADISDYKQVERLFAEMSIDVLVNNAGIAYNGLFQDMNPKEWNELLAVNLNGVLNCSRLAVPDMIKKKRGVIINISSVWGKTGASCEAVYSMTKGGINAFTKALAKELAPSGIRVNAIACGVIGTKMNEFLNEEEKNELIAEIPAGRIGKAEEVAELTAFLASDKAEYINGQIITIDGGMI